MQHAAVMIVAFLAVLQFFLLYQWIKAGPKGEGTEALMLKGTATFCCAALALYGAWLHQNAGYWLLGAGLIVCTAADVLLAIRFMPGMACFALGHVCYCIAYCLLAPPTWLTLIVFIALLILVCCVIPWSRKHAGKDIAPFIAYGVVLCLMLSFAARQRMILLAGAFLFVVSDLLLGYRLVKKVKGKGYDYLCLGCYYLAQFLIGASAVIG